MKRLFQGDKGYCYIPYDYITNPRLCFDVWAVRRLATDSFSREHWDTMDFENYTQHYGKNGIHHQFDYRSQIIDVTDDDDNSFHNFDNKNDQWNRHGNHSGMFIRQFYSYIN